MSTRASSVWSKDHDQLLLNARKRGMNWVAIQQAHFPDKTPNACRKRHERLVERRTIDDWDGQKLECVAKEYMNIRKQMWSMLADRVGEKWQLIESKVIANRISECRGWASLTDHETVVFGERVEEPSNGRTWCIEEPAAELRSGSQWDEIPLSCRSDRHRQGEHRNWLGEIWRLWCL